jgi:mycothiol synthase
LDIRVFEVDRAERREFDDYYDVRLASAADWSDEPPAGYEATTKRLRDPFPGWGPVRQWAAYWDGRLVGLQTAAFPGHENDHLALVESTVHPRFRRRGIGTAMLRRSLPEIRDRGRTELEAWSVTKAGVGEQWAVGLGFHEVHVTVVARLPLHTADASWWDVAAPAGYRAVSWTGTAPEELAASYALAQDATHDAPHGSTGLRVPNWTVERIREGEARMRDQGIEQRVVVAISEADGQVAGSPKSCCTPTAATGLSRPARPCCPDTAGTDSAGTSSHRWLCG